MKRHPVLLSSCRNQSFIKDISLVLILSFDNVNNATIRCKASVVTSQPLSLCLMSRHINTLTSMHRNPVKRQNSFVRIESKTQPEV